jgi:hypothetical protein
MLMRPACRIVSVLVGVAAALLGVAACSGSSGETVARVTGVGAISKGTLDHWMPIEAVLLYEEEPRKPVPKGVIPDPPTYAACVAFLQSTRQKIVETGPKPTGAQLKTKCAKKQHDLEITTLNTLIEWEWTLGNGAILGMKITDADLQRRLEAIKKVSFPKEKEFDTYLARTNQTTADMLFRSKVQLVETRLQELLSEAQKRLPKSLTPQQQQNALIALTKSLPTPTTKQWVARTSCSPGHVTSDCKQYAGSLPPGAPN